MKKIVVVVGFTLFATAILCNLNWAVNDYGMKEISLNPRILAQTGTTGTEDGTGTGTGTGGDTKKLFRIDQQNCEVTVTGKIGAKVKLGWLTTTVLGDGYAYFKFENAQTLCGSGGNYVSCNQMTCGEFWLKIGTPQM